jgi:hypothetical protein
MKAEIRDVSVCNHGNEGFSLTLNFGDCYISSESWAYDHRPGNYGSCCIRILTPDDMYKLAEKIIEAANKINNKGI